MYRKYRFNNLTANVTQDWSVATENSYWRVVKRTHQILTPHQQLKDKPHKWEVGTEYDFGDGTFGRRFTGNIAHAANSANITNILTVNNARILSYGGWAQSGVDAARWNIGTSAPSTSSFAPMFLSSLSVNNANSGILFWSISSVARTGTTNNAYDIWVRYTKA
jgi:hypothetical protein